MHETNQMKKYKNQEAKFLEIKNEVKCFFVQEWQLNFLSFSIDEGEKSK